MTELKRHAPTIPVVDMGAANADSQIAAAIAKAKAKKLQQAMKTDDSVAELPDTKTALRAPSCCPTYTAMSAAVR